MDSKNSELREGQFGEWIRASNGRGFNNSRPWGGKSITRPQDTKKPQSPAEESGGSKEGVQEIGNISNSRGEVGNSLCLNMVCKASEDKNSKENEPTRGGSQGDSEKGIDCDQKGLKFLADTRGLVEVGVPLLEVGLQGKDNSGGGFLLELDQNRGGHKGMTVDSRNHGSWKRRARAIHVASGKENEQGMSTHNAGVGSKRVFQLRDEDEEAELDGTLGKKIKSGVSSLLPTDSQVEVASQKWPQFNQ